MALPKTVQRQLEAAEALAAAQAQAPQPSVVTDVSQLAAAPAPQEPPAAPAAQPASPAEDWQQKYRSLQGMYQAEVPELRAKTKLAESELTALKEQVRALTVAAQAAQQATKTEPDPRDVSAFGEDMIDMVRRYAEQTLAAVRGEVTGQLQTLDARVGALEGAVTGVSKRTEATLETQFYAALTSMVPDWKELNASEPWLAWLSQVDEVYGVPRQAALDQAHQRGDVERVAAVFKMFKAQQPARPSAALASQVSPDAGGGASAPQAPQARPLMAQKAVQTFYNDVARGRYRGREAEAERIEAEINQAAAEGRIV